MAKPQIRIKGYDEEWEDITLNDICTINPPSIVPEVFEYVDLESVVGTEIVAHRTETRSTAPSRAQRRTIVYFETKNRIMFSRQAMPR